MPGMALDTRDIEMKKTVLLSENLHSGGCRE